MISRVPEMPCPYAFPYFLWQGNQILAQVVVAAIFMKVKMYKDIKLLINLWMKLVIGQHLGHNRQESYFNINQQVRL